MTPAIHAARKAKIVHRIHAYEHDPANASYGLEAVQKLGLPSARVFKTLIVQADNKTLVVAVLPVSGMLNMKSMAKAIGAKKAAMADPADAERATGYVLGGVSPLGQKKNLQTIIDASAQNFATIYVSAGRRGLQIELGPRDLQQLTRASFAEICSD